MSGSRILPRGDSYLDNVLRSDSIGSLSEGTARAPTSAVQDFLCPPPYLTRKVLNSASKALALFSEGGPVAGYPGTNLGDF